MKNADKVQSVSFRSKVIFLINLIFLIVLSLVILITIFFGHIWSEQIVTNADNHLRTVTQQVEDRLNRVVSISQAVLQNRPFLDRLEQTSMTGELLERIDLRNDLQQEMDAIRHNNSTIKEIYVLNEHQENQVGFIYDKDDIGNHLSVSEIINHLGDSRKGQWFFDQGLNTGIYAQQLFRTDSSSYQQIGTIILKADLGFIHEALSNFSNNEELNFFGIHYNDALFLSDQKYDVADIIPNRNVTQLQKKRIGNTTFYIARNSIGEVNLLYFITTDQGIKKILFVEGVLLIWCLLVLLMLFIYSYKSVGRLLFPIEKLSSILSSFKEEGDIKRIENELNQFSTTYQDAETETLYKSSTHLLSQLDESVVQNYQLQLMNQQSEFQSLQAQLDPHFLYNTLDSINWLAVKSNEPRIAEMVSSLAYLFRKKLNSEGTFITIREELSTMQSYVNIQKIRFENRLLFKTQIDKSLLDIMIPKMIIQPLVENSMKYALSMMDETCIIELSIKQKSNDVEISVTDNGPGFENTKDIDSSKVGLANIESRIRLLYKNQGSLKIKSEPYDTTTVIVTIPLLMEANKE